VIDKEQNKIPMHGYIRTLIQLIPTLREASCSALKQIFNSKNMQKLHWEWI